MANYCAVFNCKNTSEMCDRATRNISFYRFPDDPKLKQLWIKATGRRMWQPSKYSSICSVHFKEDDYKTALKTKMRRLSREAVPSIDVHKTPVACQNKTRKTSTEEVGDLNTDEQSPLNELTALQADLELKKVEVELRRAQNRLLEQNIMISKCYQEICESKKITKYLNILRQALMPENE